MEYISNTVSAQTQESAVWVRLETPFFIPVLLLLLLFSPFDISSLSKTEYCLQREN